MAQNIS